MGYSHFAQRVNVGAIFVVANDAVVSRIGSGRNRRGVHFRRTGVNGMMMRERNSGFAQIVKGRAVLFGDEIGPHAVPDDDNDSAV